MEVIEKYLECKMRIGPLESDLKWIDKQMNIIRVSTSGNGEGGGGNKSSKLDKFIENKQAKERELEECLAYVDHVEGVLKVLNEKYEDKKFLVFEMNCIEGQSLRSTAEETHYSHTQVKRISEMILSDFIKLTQVLI